MTIVAEHSQIWCFTYSADKGVNVREHATCVNNTMGSFYLGYKGQSPSQIICQQVADFFRDLHETLSF